jgi:hypothetical protein
VAVDDLPASKLKSALQAIVVAAAGDVVKFRGDIERWFNAEMDRVTGWYKRDTKRILVALSVVVVLAVNIDSIGIVRTLWASPQTRSAVTAAAQAEIAAGATTTTTAAGAPVAAPIVCHTAVVPSAGAPAATTTTVPSVLQQTTDCLNQLKSLGVPLGWRLGSCAPTDACRTFWQKLDHGVRAGLKHSGTGGIILKLLGWLLSIGALSMGAPFWWDLLNRFGSLQSTGTKPTPPGA